ncbi:MAG: 50S ribosomal protein L4 [Verrucomicrobiales bacterium]|nr:50S ribosomal protein L4 [Verrucomicrobiales bacterium]|tara:strand:- start:19728 stop:20354 length:627 start_codon:yes stop_codon:yes gene_type:complete
MNLTVKAKDGSDAGSHEVGFDVIENAKGTQAVHEVVTAYRAAQRSGTAKVKNRSEVRGTGKKPWRQKGTGRARVGSRRNPVWRGGGVAHGPVPRDYSKKINSKTRKLALRKALGERIKDGDVIVVDDLVLESKRTKDFVKLMASLEVDSGASILLVDRANNENLRLGSRNVPGVDTETGETLNTYQVLRYDKLIFGKDAFEEVEKRLK